MRTEVRFLLAIVLMLGVLVVTNLLFPPAPLETVDEGAQDREMVEGGDPAPGEPTAPPSPAPRVEGGDPVIPGTAVADTTTAEPGADPDESAPATEAGVPEAVVVVEGPLYQHVFSTRGARLLESELLRFQSFTREGPVSLLPEAADGALQSRILIGNDTVDLRRAIFEVEPAGGLRLEDGGEPQSLVFTYRHPTTPFTFEVRYLFDPDAYLVQVSGRAQGLERAGVLFTDLGTGIAFNEADEQEDARAMAYVANHRQQGIRSTDLGRVEGQIVEEGPFFWVAFKSKYFVAGMLSGVGTPGAEAHLGGLIVRETPEEHEAHLVVTQPLAPDGSFDYRLYLGPQDYATLAELGQDFNEVNPIGWRFFRPIIRPFVAITITVLVFMHNTLSWGYGWVLILFGLLMRVLLFPLNHKAMKAQLKNMAVQPLLKEIQTRYKDNPEKMQKELMRLYKEHGFNPLAGCWPMLLPWPVLIALFFVFQNTIELRGVEFLWLPDLASKDPIYLLPVLLGLSMFLLQWVSFRTLDEINPQMKMMMWLMPIFMVVIFVNLPSGLNLYYVTANIATLPQSWWIANERKKAQAKGPLKLAPQD